ncbi:hypothetical protein [Brevibacillus agri]|uniref:hypothetical protein n=1 Tax=Brevibacillus agri TaxID=51101 RepID=UPI0018CD0D09|nr:hypothetical protein [Brevibacillus agri]
MLMLTHSNPPFLIVKPGASPRQSLRGQRSQPGASLAARFVLQSGRAARYVDWNFLNSNLPNKGALYTISIIPLILFFFDKKNEQSVDKYTYAG